MSLADDPHVVANRPVISLIVLSATVMVALDSTIANVALPHIQGSVSASSDQITWVLTFYIVASAIMTPMTGWLTGRFGMKRVFTVSIAGFTLASALCGLANSLPEIVGFRLLQGASGAALVPLSQSTMLSIYPPERRGQAMAAFGMGTMLAPIMGPALGGWITEHFEWRWNFYINVPVGIIAFFGASVFLPERSTAERRRLDFFGFAVLSLAIGSLQLMLDRGEQKDWFSSTEIWVELALAVLGFWWTAVHTVTAREPFLNRAILTNSNFMICTGFTFFLNTILFSTLALLPPLLEDLMGYPVVTTGLVTAPRGFGMLMSMFIVGRLVGRVRTQLIIITGLGVIAVSTWRMTLVNLGMTPDLVAVAGLIQGLGAGMIFVPLSTVVFATLPPNLVTEGTSFYTLMRSIGSSVGIAVLQGLLVRNTQTIHADLIRHIRPDNPNFRLYAPPGWSLATSAGRAFVNAQVTRQANMLAYVDDFRFMLIVTIIAMPLVIFMRPPRSSPGPVELHAME